jgi:nitrogen regulatory protein P-II 1
MDEHKTDKQISDNCLGCAETQPSTPRKSESRSRRSRSSRRTGTANAEEQSMKKIEAVIKPFKLEAVQRALAELGIGGMAVTEVRGFGRQRGYSQPYDDRSSGMTFLPKVKLELVVRDDHASKVKELIVTSAKTGKYGDGKVFVLPIESAMRIRTGERGEAAV